VVVRQPTDDFADLAWAILMARLNNDRSPALQSQVHADLVIRDSTIPYLGSLATAAVP
jgi:DNA-binding LacI/PurR family transcriptional regulator